MTKSLASLAFAALVLAAPALAGEPGSDATERPAFRMPPPEAIAACASLSLDASCSFTYRDRAHAGTCRRGPEGQGPIACAPDRGPRPGPGPGGGEQGQKGGAGGQAQR